MWPEESRLLRAGPRAPGGEGVMVGVRVGEFVAVMEYCNGNQTLRPQIPRWECGGRNEDWIRGFRELVKV